MYALLSQALRTRTLSEFGARSSAQYNPREAQKALQQPTQAHRYWTSGQSPRPCIFRSSYEMET